MNKATSAAEAKQIFDDHNAAILEKIRKDLDNNMSRLTSTPVITEWGTFDQLDIEPTPREVLDSKWEHALWKLRKYSSALHEKDRDPWWYIDYADKLDTTLHTLRGILKAASELDQ